MKVKLDVELKPAADTFCAALKSMLDYLGDEHPIWEIEGLSGYAFRILVHREVCPSGAHHTNWKEIHPETLRRLGWDVRFFLHIDWDRKENFASQREKMLDTITAALDQRRPVAVYDLYVPEWALVTGYDDQERKFQVSTFLNLAHWDTVPYDKLGEFNLPILYALAPGEKLPDYDRKQAYRDALAVACRHYNLHEYTWRPTVRDGKEAYNQWISTLKGYPEVKCIPAGLADYAAKYGEWRKSAAKFCREAAKLFGDLKTHLVAAAGDFGKEAETLGKLAKLFPLPAGGPLDKPRIAQALIMVRAAQTHYNAAIADMRACSL